MKCGFQIGVGHELFLKTASGGAGSMMRASSGGFAPVVSVRSPGLSPAKHSVRIMTATQLLAASATAQLQSPASTAGLGSCATAIGTVGPTLRNLCSSHYNPKAASGRRAIFTSGRRPGKGRSHDHEPQKLIGISPQGSAASPAPCSCKPTTVILGLVPRIHSSAHCGVRDAPDGQVSRARELVREIG